jgi:diamine N-acetyltransferase
MGVCGLWFQTRHYSGKSCEPDHVLIKAKYQGLGLGNKIFKFIEQ